MQGFFHADPHGGNLLATADGKLVYLDFGMMSEVCWRMLTYAHVCSRMLTYARLPRLRHHERGMLTYADVCSCMLTYADVC
jgi:hypothetical protein